MKPAFIYYHPKASKEEFLSLRLIMEKSLSDSSFSWQVDEGSVGAT